jgi:ketosteroid isomerase-like protein
VSAENVEIVRAVYDAWLGGEGNALQLLDPEIVLTPAAECDWVGLEDTYHGRDGVRRYLRLMNESIDDYHPEIVELLDAGDAVVTLAVESGRGRRSGAPVESRNTAHVWTLRDGRAVQLDLYWDRERAMRAAGIPN